MVKNAGSTGDDFGYKNFITKDIHSYRKNDVVLKDYDVKLAASKKNYRFDKLPVTLQSGKTYSISFKDIITTQGRQTELA